MGNNADKSKFNLQHWKKERAKEKRKATFFGIIEIIRIKRNLFRRAERREFFIRFCRAAESTEGGTKTCSATVAATKEGNHNAKYE